MKFSNLNLLLAFLTLILYVSSVNAQTEQNINAQAIVDKLLSDSERYFKQGELNLKDKRFPQARMNFDRAVEVFLFSTINIRRNQKLNESYLQLIDKIHLLEMSSKNKPAQSNNLNIADSSICSKTTEVNKLALDFLIQALNSYKSQDYDNSISSLRKVLIEEPMSPLAYLLMGKIHFKRGDLEQAISSFKTALFWDSRLVEAHIELGRIFIVKGNTFDAEIYLGSALDIEPDNPKVKAFSRLINKQATENDKRLVEQDAIEIEKWIKELTEQKIGNVGSKLNNGFIENLIFVAPFQSNDENNLLGQDFSFVISNVLNLPITCVVNYEKSKSLIESFGLKSDETFTLATAIKLATASKASLLIVGSYEVNKNNGRNNFNLVTATTKIIEVNEGRYLSEEFDGKRIMRSIVVNDKAENLRTLQGQIAYQILYQLHKSNLVYSQNEIIEKAKTLKIPKHLEYLLDISSETYGEPDFSIKNRLKQTDCSENILGNLQLRDFRLGITLNETLKIIPNASVKTINSSEKQIIVLPKTSPAKMTKFQGIASIQLSFFDNFLYSIGIVYDDTIKWNSLDEFSNQVEKTLTLPKIKSGEYEFDGNYLFCGKYQMKVMFAKNKTPVIHLFDTNVFGKIEQRKKEEREKVLQKKIEEEKRKRQEEEKKKKVFKP